MVEADDALADEVADVVMTQEDVAGFPSYGRSDGKIDSWFVVDADWGGLSLWKADVTTKTAEGDRTFGNASDGDVLGLHGVEGDAALRVGVGDERGGVHAN